MAKPSPRHVWTLPELLGVGARAVSKYTGTVLAVFVVQSLAAAACMVAIAFVFAQTFAHLPMFDEAVDGDLVAAIWCLRYAQPTFLAVAGLVVGALAFWQLATWFLQGGLYGVLANRPDGRGDTARCFGSSGAATYLMYARLAVCALPGYMLVMLLLIVGTGMVADRVQTALTIPQLVVPLVLAALPGLLLLHVLWTVSDYARVEMTLRQESHSPGVIATYVRSVVYVVKRPLTLVHAGVGWLLFALVTIAYAYLAQGHPMYGADGAIMLFLVRQGVSLLRLAIRVGVLAGQVELGKTRPLPPRRVEAKLEAAS